MITLPKKVYFYDTLCSVKQSVFILIGNEVIFQDNYDLSEISPQVINRISWKAMRQTQHRHQSMFLDLLYPVSWLSIEILLHIVHRKSPAWFF
jgi:hypothetical protein